MADADRHEVTLVDILVRHAAERPDVRAFVFLERGERESEVLTYAALDRRARVIARELRERGLEGRHVVLAYPPCLEFVAALFGCFYASAVAVPAPAAGHGRGFERIQAILTDAEAAAILSLSSSPPTAPDQSTDSFDIPCIATDALPDDPDNTPPASAGSNTLAMLQYTSGSTGNPRAVMLTHGNLLHNQRLQTEAFGSTGDDLVVSWLPLYHDMGLIGVVLNTVFVGGRCVLMSPLSFLQRPSRWLRAIAAYRATISTAPSFAYDLCAEHDKPLETDGLDLSSWRVAICGGEAVRPGSLRKFAERFRAAGFSDKAFAPAYGLAEATLVTTAMAPGIGVIAHPAPENGGAFAARMLACCGNSLPDQEVAIVDPETCRRAIAGSVGEIWLTGPSVGAGYWKREEETEAVFQARLAGDDRDRQWLRTGDLGYLAAEGLVITGRRKDLLVVRGANIDPQDLETIAANSDACFPAAAGAAFVLEHDGGDAVILVHEVSRAALRHVDTHAVTAKVTNAIGSGFGLTLYDLVLLRPGALPRTTSGKVQRHLCRNLYLTGALARLPAVDHPALGRCRSNQGALV